MGLINPGNMQAQSLTARGHTGELAGIIRNPTVICVNPVVTPSWVEHVVAHNWSGLLHSVTEGERAMAERSEPILTLENVFA
jgi:hypothetical protein